MSAMDRDALAREMHESWKIDDDALPSEKAADIAMRAIEAARAETNMELVTENARLLSAALDVAEENNRLKAQLNAIRAGSPAPAERNEESDEFSGSTWADEWGKE